MPLNTSIFIETLLSNSIARSSFPSMNAWFIQFIEDTKHTSSTLEHATLGGRLSNNMGFAFAAGYQSAIQALFKPTTRELASLCISEQQGSHPKAIQSTLIKHGQNWHLHGSKSFITGASEATQLYIAAIEKKETDSSLIPDNKKIDGTKPKNQAKIKIISLPSNQTGIKISTMSPLPFVPEISHGTAIFEQVKLQPHQILAGDGYDNFVKPFRTHEDIHILLAVLGFRIGEAIDFDWSHDSIEAHLCILASLLSLNPIDFNKASTHLILAGCRSQLKLVIQQTDTQFKETNPEGYKNWKRDEALLKIASKAHKARTSRAWENILSIRP